MNVDGIRTLVLSLPHVVETMQWGENLVFWVGDKAIGGRMFALVALDATEGSGKPLLSFAAGPERFAELCERDDVVPAPYLARAFWVAAMRWDAFSAAEWRDLLLGAHSVVLSRLPKRTRAAMALSAAEQGRRIAQRRQRSAREGDRIVRGGATPDPDGSARASPTAQRRARRGAQATGGAADRSGKNTRR